MKLLAYLRVSSMGQVDGFGLDVQRTACRRWARGAGHRIVGEHIDAGVSGATEAMDREGLSDALTALSVGQAHGLIVARLDRLARALTVQEAVLAHIWREHGHIFTADTGEVLQDDPDDPMRTAMRQVVGVFAELDRRMVVKRLRDGRAAKEAAGGKSVGTYGYGVVAGTPDARERAVISRITELRCTGASYRQIAATLDAEGLRPRRALSWSAATVRNIIRREGLALASN